MPFYNHAAQLVDQKAQCPACDEEWTTQAGLDIHYNAVHYRHRGQCRYCLAETLADCAGVPRCVARQSADIRARNVPPVRYLGGTG